MPNPETARRLWASARIACFPLMLIAPLPGAAEDYFTCGFLETAACLRSGDTVCDTFGKCVDQNADCFEPFTCDFKGYVCKSDLEKVVSDYNEVALELDLANRSLDSLRNQLTDAVNTISELEIELIDAGLR